MAMVGVGVGAGTALEQEEGRGAESSRQHQCGPGQFVVVRVSAELRKQRQM